MNPTTTATATTTPDVLSTPTDTAAIATVAKAKLEKSLGKSSLDAFAQGARQSVLIADCSSSMASFTANHETKIAALRTVVKNLREANPVPVIAFGGFAPFFCDDIPRPSGMTPLHRAIQFAHREHATHIVLVTDGQPDSQARAFEAAAQFGGPIDCFYIGDGDDEGAEFCRALAARTGGTCNITDLTAPKQLSAKIAGLLGDGGLL